MPEQNQQQIAEVLAEVLQNLAFMFADPATPDELPASLNDVLEARVSYRGSKQGTLTLLAPQALAGALAANVLGIEPDDPKAREGALDAVGELMNIAMGRLLTELEGCTAVFDLTPPEVQPVTSTERWGEMLHDPDVIAMRIEDSPVLLRLDRACAA